MDRIAERLCEIGIICLTVLWYAIVSALMIAVWLFVGSRIYWWRGGN